MVENAIVGSGYGRTQDQLMVEKHRQVVGSTVGQDQLMVELTYIREITRLFVPLQRAEGLPINRQV
jgi:hypothetical protein